MERFQAVEVMKARKVPRVPANIVQEVANLAQQAYQDPKRLNRSVTSDKACQSYLLAALESKGYSVLVEEGIREAFADYRGPQKRSIMMLDKKVCVELKVFVGLPKAPHITQLKSYMTVTDCDCGMVICFPNDGSNSIDVKFVTFEKGRFKTNELFWREGFICPDTPADTSPSRPGTGQRWRAYGAEASLQAEDQKAASQPKDAPGQIKAAKTARGSSKEEALRVEVKALRSQNEQMLEDQRGLAEQMQQLQQKFLAHMEASAAQLEALRTQLAQQPSPPDAKQEDTSVLPQSQPVKSSAADLVGFSNTTKPSSDAQSEASEQTAAPQASGAPPNGQQSDLNAKPSPAPAAQADAVVADNTSITNPEATP
ncbi:hypothetical protein WJX84_011899 [Apatococcus fuscideae]|uniref:Uncharacterized protein n=1 Tax=Apatococcus fuscideae TaxID=2026836 RepID=A0AAW1T884_9CHLO